MATADPVLAGDRAWVQEGVLPFLQNDLPGAFRGFLASLLLPATGFSTEKAFVQQHLSRRWLFMASNVETMLDLGLQSEIEKLRRHLRAETSKRTLSSSASPSASTSASPSSCSSPSPSPSITSSSPSSSSSSSAAAAVGGLGPPLPKYLEVCRNFPKSGAPQIVAEFLGEALRLDPDELLVYQELFTLFEEHRLELSSLAEAAALRGLLLHPLQRPTVLFELESRPFWALSQLREDAPWILELEAQWKLIRGELDRALSSTRQAFAAVGGEHRAGGRHDGEVLKKGRWSEVVLYGLDAEESRMAEKLFPRTRRLLSALLPTATSMAEEGFGEIIVSRLAPNSHIAPHCAPNNARLTAHLGLIVPKGCRIRVGEEWRGWEEGKMLLFDDSYEHEVVTGSEERVVLLIRFWHPQCRGREDSFRARDDRCFNWANFRKTMPPLADPEVEQAMFGYDLCDEGNCCKRCRKPMSENCFPAFFLDQATLKLRADFRCTAPPPKQQCGE